MGKLHHHLTRLHVAWRAHPRRFDERGDVPGWVLVTLMSVTLVLAIGAVAQPQLEAMLRTALGKVN